MNKEVGLNTMSSTRSEPKPLTLDVLLPQFMTVVYYVLLILLAASMIIPFLWMFSSSLKTTDYILDTTPQLIPDPLTFESYSDLADVLPLRRLFLNSLFVAGAGTLGQVIVSAMAAYAFSRMRWKGRDTVFLLYLATLMVPTQVTVIPQFLLMRQLDWVNSYQGLILPTMFSAFGTFLLRQFFMSLPRELEEAAFIDGANHFTIFWRIILPLSRPALGTLTVFQFYGSVEQLSVAVVRGAGGNVSNAERGTSGTPGRPTRSHTMESGHGGGGSQRPAHPGRLLDRAEILCAWGRPHRDQRLRRSLHSPNKS
jgi:ABC-type glycerol-3-phosphate transport system permease component